LVCPPSKGGVLQKSLGACWPVPMVGQGALRPSGLVEPRGQARSVPFASPLHFVRRQRLVEFSGLFYCLVVNVRVVNVITCEFFTVLLNSLCIVSCIQHFVKTFFTFF